MSTGEDIVTYGRRAVKLSDRLAATGVPVAQIPDTKQQSMRFIDGLSSTVQVYHDYKNYLSNSLECTAIVRLNTRCHLLAFAAKVEKQLQATVSIQ